MAVTRAEAGFRNRTDEGAVEMDALAPAVHRAVVCVDVEGFTDRRRTHPDQAAVRDGLYQALNRAFARAGVSWQDWYREDRGDGALILVPPEVPKVHLVTGFPRELAAALAEHNEAHDEWARIRLRLALHAGEIHHDDHGVTGTAINLAFRLLEAGPLKKALAESTGTLALAASHWFFEEVVRHSEAASPGSYRQVQVEVKETRTSAWICRPDDPYLHPSDKAAFDGPRQGAKWPVPRQLPPATSVFVGRQTDLNVLDGLLDDDDEVGAVVISAIAGGAGVGKTTLAVQWAHRIRERFPDGDLFVNLRGYDPADPLSPLEALDYFLRALDVPTTRIPLDLQSRAALFRSLLAGRQILIVLDNAGSADQVRPLLPGVPGCLVLITSRSRLAGLSTREGAQRLSLDVLPVDQAMQLLRRTIGAARVDAEPDQARNLAERCACLPLALRIAADRAADHPHLKLADLVEELTDEHGRLDLLATDEEATAVRAVFSWSYRQLPDDAARAFRLLGLNPGPDIALNSAAALLGLPVSRARIVLGKLTGQHLLENSGRDRYRFHDLLRVYAAECAGRDDAQSTRETALERLFNWYLHTADSGYGVLLPHGHQILLDEIHVQETPPLTFTNHTEALDWFERERVNLVAAVQHAAGIGQYAIAWRLAHDMVRFLTMWWYPDDWLAVLRTGLTAARESGDVRAQAVMLLLQGDRLHEFGRDPAAIALYQEALPLARDAGDRWIEGFCHSSLGSAHAELGDLDAAVRQLRSALHVFRGSSERRGEGIALSNLGDAYLGLGQFGTATDCHRQALEILAETGNDESRAATLRRIGDVHSALRRYDQAAQSYQEAFAVLFSGGYRRQAGITLIRLGDIHLTAGRPESARQCLQDALVIFNDLDHAQAARVRAKLAAISPQKGVDSAE